MGADTRQPLEDWSGRSLASLMGHIVETHHTFCRQEVVRLATLFKEVIDKHGKIHPELKQMHDLFFQMSRDLSMHLAKEEKTLFPYITRVEEESSQGASMSWPPFGTVENPIRMMVLEHVKTDDEIEQIRKLSDNYTLPADACDRYAALYEGLAAFDRDMQRHIHVENDLLFPRAVAVEEEVCGRQKTAKV